MKQIMRISVVLFVIAAISVSAYAQPQIPKEKIPADISSGVREQIEKLYSSNAVERGRAAHRLGKMRAKAAPAVPFLIEILSDRSKLQWRTQWKSVEFPGPATSLGRIAADALGKIGEPAVEPLIEALKHGGSAVRELSAETLGKIRDVRAVEPLMAAMKDEDSGVRTRAAIALMKLGDVRRVEHEPLIAGLKDESSDIRAQAAQALEWIGDARAVEPLMAALRDGSLYVRVAAAKALGSIGDARAVEPLIEALEDEALGLRRAAAYSLRHITGQGFGDDPSKWQEWWGENKDEMLKSR